MKELSCVLILISCFMLNACGIGGGVKIQEQMLVPPTELNRVIGIVTVENFSGQYGEELANQIRADLVSEGYIKISATGSENVLTVNIYTDIKSNSNTRTQDVEKEKDGKKYTETVTTYHAYKECTLFVTYSLISEGEVLVENQYTANSFSISSESSISEKDALETLPDDGIVLSETFRMFPKMLPELSKKIIHEIFPHKEFSTFELRYGGDHKLQAGIDFYKKQLYPQAEVYWNAVANISSSDSVYYNSNSGIKASAYYDSNSRIKASAYYNLGVLRIRQNNFQDAFQMFAKANRLNPSNPVYTEALQKLVNAGLIEQILLSPCRSVPAATTIKPAANMNETTHSTPEKKN